MYLRAGSSKSSGHRGSGEAAGQDGVRACGTTSPPITIRRAGMSATRRVMTLPPCLPPDLRHMRSCATAGTAWSCRAPFGLEKPEAPSRQCARDRKVSSGSRSVTPGPARWAPNCSPSAAHGAARSSPQWCPEYFFEREHCGAYFVGFNSACEKSVGNTEHLTWASSLGARALPPRLSAHDAVVRMAGAACAQRSLEGHGDLGVAARGRGPAPSGHPSGAALG